MGRSTIPTPDEALAQLYRAGYTLKECAVRYGLSQTTVWRRIRKQVTMRRPNQRTTR